MEQIVNLSLAEEQELQKVKQLLSMTRRTVAEEPSSLKDGIGVLERLRKDIYEDLNQILHEAMILRAALDLQSKDLAKKPVDWYWNPRQTGGLEEPDLRGIVGGSIHISAEITASKSLIDKRIGTTLEKLSKMPGKKIYFVRTEPMEKRAKTKVSKAGYTIEIRQI